MGRYVGARYVPIMAGAWDNTREYEPLTVVQYEGDTYTSKMYVPVGIAITNTTYWVKTGNFNQQVANLAQSLQQTDNRVQDIEGDLHDAQTQLSHLPTEFDIDYVFKEFTSLQPGEAATGTITIDKPGYYVLALVGWEVASFRVTSLSVTNAGVVYTVVNDRDTAIGGSLRVNILFGKN